jgi:hypothetical protein
MPEAVFRCHTVALPLRRGHRGVRHRPLPANAQLKCQHGYQEPAGRGAVAHAFEPTLLTETREGTHVRAPYPVTREPPWLGSLNSHPR